MTVFIRESKSKLYTHKHQDDNLKIKAKSETSAAEDVETLEFLDPRCTDGKNMKWCSHCGRQYDNSSKNLNIELLQF